MHIYRYDISLCIDDIYLQDDRKEKYIKYITDTVTLLKVFGAYRLCRKMTVLLKKEKKTYLACFIRKKVTKKIMKNKKACPNSTENSSCITRLDK